jgi:hypothetical protein
MWQTINFNVLIQLLLPTFLRKNRLVTFLEINIKPLDNLYKKTLYDMQHTCQVYTQDESRPAVDYDNMNLYLDEDDIFLEDDLPHFDFVVNIPSTITFIEAQLRAIIDYYKLAGKKYRIAP